MLQAGYKTNLEMLQSVNEFLLTLENQHKPSVKLLETPSSVDDIYYHNRPSSLRVLVLKSIFVSSNLNFKIHQLSTSKTELDQFKLSKIVHLQLLLFPDNNRHVQAL